MTSIKKLHYVVVSEKQSKNALCIEHEIVFHFDNGGEAVDFKEGESNASIVRKLRDLAERIERRN